jgi:DNA-binding CsgD family transcriptional regulator
LPATGHQARGQHRRAEAFFGQAAEAWESLPRPHDVLLARENQACCLLADGRAGAGIALFSDVFQGLRRLGARGDAERVAARLRECGIQVWRGWSGGRRSYGAQLSPREIEVVRLVAAGHTNREVAAVLCRSPSTVKKQLTSAMGKLNVSSRVALAATAVEAGLVAGD